MGEKLKQLFHHPTQAGILMVHFGRGRNLLRGSESIVPVEKAEPSLSEVLRDPIVRTRMAADNIRIRDILDLAIEFRNSKG